MKIRLDPVSIKTHREVKLRDIQQMGLLSENECDRLVHTPPPYFSTAEWELWLITASYDDITKYVKKEVVALTW